MTPPSPGRPNRSGTPGETGLLAGARSLTVIKPSSLGDVVHALPCVHVIKLAHPALAIRWIVNREWAPLLADNPDLDEVTVFPRHEFRGLRAVATAWRFQRALRHGGRPDVALDLQGLLRSALIAKAARAHTIFGLSDAREGAASFYHQVIEVSPLQHAVDRYLAAATALGADPGRPGMAAFPLPPGTTAGLPELPELPVVLHPFSRGQGKSLSPSHIQLFCDALSPRPVVVVGMHPSPPPELPANTLDLTNRTDLPQLIAVLRRAGFVVSVDSGPMHIAAAITDRILGIHTWTDPRRVGPYPSQAKVWKSGKIVPRSALTPADCETDAPLTRNDIIAIAEHTLEMC